MTNTWETHAGECRQVHIYEDDKEISAKCRHDKQMANTCWHMQVHADKWK